MTRRVLVTGAAGNIGSVVMRELAGDFELVGLDVTEAPGIAGVDIGDYDALLPHLAGIDTVVHLGADPSPSAPWDSVLHNNIIGTRNVYEAAVEHGVRRVVFASSTSRRSAGSPRNRGLRCSTGLRRRADFGRSTPPSRSVPAGITAPARRGARFTAGSTRTTTGCR